jgi:T-complex protein 1 subunit epsilon
MSSFGTLAFDEYGRPFIILKDQDKQKRLVGIEAHKVDILCTCSIMSTTAIKRYLRH